MQGKALLFFSVFYPQRTHCFSTVFLLCCGCFVFYSILSPLCPAICYVSSFFFRFTNARMSFSHGTNDTAICVMCLYVCAFKQMAVATGCDWCFVSIISNSLATRFEFDAHGRYRHCCQWHIKQIGMDAKYRLCHNSAECSLRKKTQEIIWDRLVVMSIRILRFVCLREIHCSQKIFIQIGVDERWCAIRSLIS